MTLPLFHTEHRETGIVKRAWITPGLLPTFRIRHDAPEVPLLGIPAASIARAVGRDELRKMLEVLTDEEFAGHLTVHSCDQALCFAHLGDAL